MVSAKLLNMGGRTRLALVAGFGGAALAAIAVIGALQTADAADENPERISAEQAAERHALDYAAEVGASVQESRARITIEEQMRAVVGELRAAAPQRFAAIWIEHKPSLRYVAFYTGTADGLSDMFEIAKTAPAELEIRTGAPHSLDTLLAVRQEAITALRTAGPIGPSEIDEIQGRVLITLLPGSPQASAPSGIESSLEAEFGVDFVIDVAPNPWRRSS